MPDEPGDIPATTPPEEPSEEPSEKPADQPAEDADQTARLKDAEEPVKAEPVPAPDPIEAPAVEPADAPVETVAAEPASEVPPAAPAKAPAKRPAKKAPVPLATPVKKAPVKKAAAKTPAVKAPAAKAPAAKRAPAKKLAVPEPGTPPLTPWPVSQAPVPAPAVVAAPPAAPAPVVPPAAPVAAVAPAAEAPSKGDDGLLRFLIMLAVLLLAAAAGLGAAAFVEHRDTSYRAEVLVQLAPGPDPAAPVADALAQGVERYASQTSAHPFTATAVRRAGLSPSASKGDVVGKAHGTNQVELVVLAATAQEARTFATGAGDALVELVNLDQVVSQASPGDRLSAAVIGEPQGVTKAAPKDRDAWIAAVLAAAAVLVLAGVATLLRLTRRT